MQYDIFIRDDDGTPWWLCGGINSSQAQDLLENLEAAFGKTGWKVEW